MKKILFLALTLIAPSVALISCIGSSNPVQDMADKYHSEEISTDSMLKFVSDSVNIEAVLEWANKNIEKDDLAAYILGRNYKFGFGVERNPLKSIFYYRKAVENGNINAMLGLGQLYASYPGHENLDSAKILFTKAAEKGDGSGYYWLSQLLVTESMNNGSPLDTTAVMSLVEKGMKLNDPMCMGVVASSYYTGLGAIKKKKKAFEILSLAPEDKLVPQSLNILGEMYELGEVVPQNFNSAFHYYKKSANMGDTFAQCKLGNFYAAGQGIEKNDSLAFLEYQKAANAGNSWAMRCVGYSYLTGTGIKEDRYSGNQWLSNAAKHGDDIAIDYCKRNNIEYK